MRLARHAAECCLPLQGIEKSDTWFGIALKVVRAMLKKKIISSPNDQTAVILYGTVRVQPRGME